MRANHAINNIYKLTKFKKKLILVCLASQQLVT